MPGDSRTSGACTQDFIRLCLKGEGWAAARNLTAELQKGRFQAENEGFSSKNFGGEYLRNAAAPGKMESGIELHFSPFHAGMRALSVGTSQKKCAALLRGLRAVPETHVAQCPTAIQGHTGGARSR